MGEHTVPGLRGRSSLRHSPSVGEAKELSCQRPLPAALPALLSPGRKLEERQVPPWGESGCRSILRSSFLGFLCHFITHRPRRPPRMADISKRFQYHSPWDRMGRGPCKSWKSQGADAGRASGNAPADPGHAFMAGSHSQPSAHRAASRGRE